MFQDGAKRARVILIGTLTQHPAAALLSTLILIAIGAFLVGPLTLVALGVIAALMAFPGWLLAAYLLVPPLYKAAIQPYVAFDVTVGLAIPVVLIGVRFLVRHRLRRSSMLPLVLWSALALVVIVGVWVADDRARAVGEASYWIALAYLPLSASLMVACSPAHLRQFLLATLFLCLPFVILGVLLLIVSLPEPTPGFLRVFGANYIGVGRASFLVALLGMGYPGSWLLDRSRITRLLLVVTAVTVGVAAGARGPVLTFVVVAIAWMLVRLVRSEDWGRMLVRVVLPVSLAVGAAVGAAAALFPVVVFRFTLLFEYAASLLGFGDAQGGASISARSDAYRLAADLFRAEPFIGAGTGAYAAAARSQPAIASFEYPHNSVLQFAAEFGLVGLVLFAAILVVAFTRRVPEGAGWATVRAVAVFLALGGLLSNGIYEYRIFWAYLLLLMAAPAHQTPSLLPDRARLRAGHPPTST